MGILLATYEELYDSYAGLLYSIALDIAPSREEAERLLVLTFVKARCFAQDSIPPTFMEMLQVLISAAHEENILPADFRIKELEKMPIINEVICTRVSIDEYCTQHNISRYEATSLVRREFNNMMSALKT